MRKFYQVYANGLWCLSDNTKLKMLSVLANKKDINVYYLDKEPHQFVVRYRYLNQDGNEEVKIGNDFIQVSSEVSAERSQEMFDKIIAVIPREKAESNDELPF